jgi:hypothetical protein
LGLTVLPRSAWMVTLYSCLQCRWDDRCTLPHPTYWDELSLTFCLSWPWTVNLPISTSQVTDYRYEPLQASKVLFSCMQYCFNHYFFLHFLLVASILKTVFIIHINMGLC